MCCSQRDSLVQNLVAQQKVAAKDAQVKVNLYGLL